MKKMTSLVFIFLAFLLTTVHANEKKFNLIWQVSPEKYYEVDWVREILEGIEYNEIIDGNYQVIAENAIVVICLDGHNLYKDYFAKFNQSKHKYGIIHVSDELYGHPTDCYKKAAFVLRNYWHKKFIGKKNVYAFPLGYSTGFWRSAENRNVKPASERQYAWSFAGQITDKPTRKHMINHLKTVPNYHIYETFQWADPNSLSKEEYRGLMMESIFIPCPTGWWNLDSFRLCEALECGCIPIVEKKPFDYFSRLMGGKYPFPAVKDWSQAPEIMEKLMADPVQLEKVRARCHRWWLRHKAKIKKEIATLCKKKLS